VYTLHRIAFRYTAERRVRIEAVCFRRQRAFARTDPLRLERWIRAVLREEEERVVAVREGAAGIRVDLPRDAARLELLGMVVQLNRGAC
jgi:hypothetical protein